MHRALLALALPLAAAASALAQAPDPAPGETPGYVRLVAPFEVRGHDGRPYTHPLFGGFTHPRPQLVDLNGDGRLDLVVQEDLDRLVVFERTGPYDPKDPGAAFTWRSDAWLGLEVGTWFRFADLTGDGRPDLLAQHPSGQVRFYRHVGTPEAPRFTLAAGPLLDTEGRPVLAEDQNVPAVADLDADGRPDLFLGLADRGNVRYYRHAGLDDRGVPRFEHVTDRFQGIEIYEPTPTCDPFAEPELPPIPTSGAALAPGGRPSRLHGENALAFADIDASGTKDLFWGDFFTPSLYYFRNEGTPEAPVFRFVAPRFPLEKPLTSAGYNVPTFGDVTEDGLLDLVVGIVGGFCSSTANLTDNLYLLRNEGTPEAPAFREATARLIRGVDVGRVAIPAVADVDGDGLPDLLVGTAFNPRPDGPRRGSLVLYRNVGGPGAPAFALADDDFLALDLDFANHYAPAFADLSGDGRPDLVVGTFGGRLFLLRRTDEGFAEPEPLVDREGRPLDVGQTATPTLADLTGNGLPDLVVGSFRGHLTLFHHVGGPGEPVFEEVTRDFLGFASGRSSAPHLADLTGNGLPDLLVGTEREGVHVFHNEGAPGAPSFRWVGRLDPGRSQLAPVAVDLFETGVPDLLLGTRAGGLIYLRRVE